MFLTLFLIVFFVNAIKQRRQEGIRYLQQLQTKSATNDVKEIKDNQSIGM